MEQFIILKIFRQTGLNLNEKRQKLVRPANITEDIWFGKMYCDDTFSPSERFKLNKPVVKQVEKNPGTKFILS
jgi:hypothetical protein